MRKSLLLFIVVSVIFLGYQGFIGYRQYQDKVSNAEEMLLNVKNVRDSMYIDEKGDSYILLNKGIVIYPYTTDMSKTAEEVVGYDVLMGLSLFDKLKPNYNSLNKVESTVNMFLLVSMLLLLLSERKYRIVVGSVVFLYIVLFSTVLYTRLKFPFNVGGTLLGTMDSVIWMCYLISVLSVANIVLKGYIGGFISTKLLSE